MSDKPLYTVTEAARMLGVHPDTLRQWHRKGIAHALVTITGHRRFTQEEIERLMPRATDPQEA
jgi:excisionase family DNA binding protein